MTREEAIKAIKSHCYFANLVPIGKEALDMAIEALEAKPCEDAISRKAAIVQLYHNKTGDDDVDVIIERDIATIHKLPPVTPKLKWIPVSKRLPEKSMRCLVAVGRFNFTEIATYSDLMGIINHKIFYQGEVGHDSFKDITQYVKAWMPLPRPYKGGKEK
jgi:hypothetical protein